VTAKGAHTPPVIGGTDIGRAGSTPDVRSLVALLRREMLAPEPSTPGGRPLVGEALAHELGYRKGWRDRTERLIAWLEQGDAV
jgi:hypothetical protein